MKPLVKKQTLKSSGIQTSVKFGIKSSGIHHILGILRDQLYSDKILAVIREYVCNAQDEHIGSGKGDRPVEVTFPSRLSPSFKVRDFGDGLTDEDIETVYAFYGESTKRHTNDQTGMLGIGSKSAFAYGDNFVINSFIDGKKHTYNAFIDPSQVGQISKLSIEDTDEENGIEIVVPTRDDDCAEWRDKGYALFEWFSVRPIVKGVTQFEYKDDDVLFSGTNWEWRDCKSDNYSRYHRSNYGNFTVVMGNIGYPVKSSDLNLDYDDKISHLVAENLVLRVPIGDVEISASREKLQFTDYTRKKLKSHLFTVRKELSTQIGEQFKGCKTLFDAKCLYGSTFRTDSPLYALSDVIKDHLVWNGKQVNGDAFETYQTGGAQTVKFKKSFRSERYSSDERGSFTCDKSVVIIENDIGHRRGMMGRILPLIHNEGKTPVLLEFNSYQSEDGIRSAARVKKNWLKASKFDGTLLKLSELPKHKITDFVGYNRAKLTGSTTIKNGKHSAKLFELDTKCSLSNYHTPRSDFWKISEVDTDKGGVYVIIDKFEIEQPKTERVRFNRPHHIISELDKFKVAGIKPPKIYAVKIKQRSQLEGKEGWTEFHTWAREKIIEALGEGELAQSYINFKAAEGVTSGWWNKHHAPSVIKELMGLFDELAAPQGTLGDFLTKYREMRGGKQDAKRLEELMGLADSYADKKKLEVKPTYDLDNLFELVEDTYSMLKHIDKHQWGWKFDEMKADVINYVNVIDVCAATKQSNTTGV